ncbi:unnamed protein product, partial [Staurois parvus]
MQPCEPRFARAREPINLNGLLCPVTRREEVPALLLKTKPHGNLGSQYGCVLQCGRRVIRTNGTRLQVHIPLCGWCSCMDFHAYSQPHNPHICEPSL